MNFNFSEEQKMLKESVARFVADDYDFASRRRFAESADGFSRKNWQTFAELGWLSIPFAEEFGGFGGRAVEIMVVMEELGQGLVIEPFVPTVLLFGGLLNRGGNRTLQQALIPGIVDGSVQGAFAYLERQSRYVLSDIMTTATAGGDGYVLNGEKTVVFNGAAADQIIVAARTGGGQSDEQGITLLLVDGAAAGIERTSFRLIDGQKVANIKFTNVSVAADHLIGEPGQGFTLMKAVIDEVMIALCAEALGIMQKLNATTVEYTKTRQQFGVPIGSFQALQHRMVDMFMACEQTKSLLYRAVCSIEEGSDEAAKNILALKVKVGRAGKLIGGESIQLHGGMGMTDELAVGHYVKRLMTINTMFGDADHHQQRFAALTNA